MQPGMLVVDDDAGIREVLRLLLEDAGYQVREAGDGNIALRMLREMAEPHIVLLDQHLPGLTGSALLQEVARDTALRARHAYVLLTANVSTQARQLVQSMPQLDVAVVTKPFDVDALLETITSITSHIADALAMCSGEKPCPVA